MTAECRQVETLGSLRELTADLPDETRISVVVRMADDPDHFHPEQAVEPGSLVDMHTNPPTLLLTIPEPEWEGHYG